MQGAFFVQKLRKGGGKLHNTNITLAISDQRKHFYQWDTGRKLIVTGLAEGSQIHFHREGMAQPFTLPVYAVGSDLFCNVPDELLQKAKSFAAYTYITDKNGNLTRSRKTFAVEDRPKPVDYIYTETENYTLEKAIEEALKDVIDGHLDLSTNPAVLELDAKVDTKQEKLYFDGKYDAESNKAATVETVIRKVAEIVANAPEDFNTLKELSDWLITHGAEAAEMNSAIKANADGIAEINEGLTEYVKYTDEPGNTVAGGKPGVVGLNYATSCGLRIEGGAGKRYLMVYGGNNTDVLRRNGACVVTLANMDDRVKVVITGAREKNVNGSWVKSYGNQPTLTDEEKSSAAKWLGVPNAYEVDNPEMVVDIPFTSGSAHQISPDEYAYLVSDKTFTKEELLNNGLPFFFEVLNTSSGVKQTFGLAEATINEYDGYIEIRKYIDNCSVTVYIVYDNTVARMGDGGNPSSNGIYFWSCTYHNYRVERLYRDGKEIKLIDNKYLDLENSAVIKSLMARIAALEAKA